MNTSEVRKRKACSACTIAKAKCSPFMDRTDLCHRCERLNKECIFEDSQRKRGPRNRSRMKALEQRVESLMGVLSKAGGNVQGVPQPTTNSDLSPGTTAGTSDVSSAGGSAIGEGPSGLRHTPEETRDPSSDKSFTKYDPVAAGLITTRQADELLNEYQNAYTQQFPFVVVDGTVNANTLRRRKPFLFLSIMATASFKIPALQQELADKFMKEVADRITLSMLSGLEVLQGMLVRAAYHQFFNTPGMRRPPLVVHLCVAIAQDIGRSKNATQRHKAGTRPEISCDDKRALLGTYYIAAQFAHVWRTRTSMQYTRSLARHCQYFSDHPQCPSDVLIAPLIRLSELMCRITEEFSYDEVAYSAINGDSMLDFTTNNFRNELQRLQDSIPEAARQNTTVRSISDLTNVWIHECSMHNSLWTPQPTPGILTITPTRARMLQLSMNAGKTYIRNIILAPGLDLHHITLPTWSGWYYSTLMLVRLIFLHDINRSGAPGMVSVSRDVDDLLPEQEGDNASQEFHNMTTRLSETTVRDAPMAAQEAEVISLFETCLEKTLAAAPDTQGNMAGDPKDASLLMRVVALERALIGGLKQAIGIPDPIAPPNNQVPHSMDNPTRYPEHPILQPSAFPADQRPLPQAPMPSMQPMQPMQYGEPLDFSYFENPHVSAFPQVQQPSMNAWMWDLVMEDVPAFNM